MPNERGTLANKKAVAAAEMEPVTPVTAYPKDIYAMMSPAQRKEAMTPNIVRRAIPIEEPVRRAEPVPRPEITKTIKPPQLQAEQFNMLGPFEPPKAIKPGIRDYLDEVTSEENKDINFSNRIKSYYASNPSFGDELAGKLSSDMAPAWEKFWDQLSSGNRAGAIVSANTSISAGNTIPESFFLNALQRDRIIREASRQDMEE